MWEDRWINCTLFIKKDGFYIIDGEIFAKHLLTDGADSAASIAGQMCISLVDVPSVLV